MSKTLKLTGAEDVHNVYVTDLSHRAFRAEIDNNDGAISISLPERPVSVHVQLVVPNYGLMWTTADNGGHGYEDEAELSLLEELAMSRIRRCEKRALTLDFEEPPDEALEAAWDLYDLGRPMESLHCGILAGEDLEFASAQFALEVRNFGDDPPATIASTLFGERLDQYSIGVGPDWLNAALPPNFLHPRDRWELLTNVFDGTTLPSFWRWIEFGQGKKNWAPVEEILSFCDERGMLTKTFSIFWGGIGGMPPWFRELAFDEKLKAVEKWTREIVKRLKGRIVCWEISNEMHDWEFANRVIPKLTHEQAIEITRLVSELVGSLDPGTPRIINHCSPWGDYIQQGKSGPWVPLTELDDFVAAGIEFEGIGVQMYNPGRDLMECIALIDRFAEFGKTIWITEMGTPSSSLKPEAVETGQIDPTIGWRGPWEQENQADWIEMFFTMALSRTCVKNITYWDFDDERAFIRHAGLLDEEGTPKESYERLMEFCIRYSVGGSAGSADF